MQHLPVIFKSVQLSAPHYETLRDAANRKLEKAKMPKDHPDVIDSKTMEEKGYVLRRRSEVQSDEEIVEVVRHKGEVLPRRPRYRRRPSSMEDMQSARSGRKSQSGRGAGAAGYESEGSIPPRDRRPKSAASRRRKRSSSSSSSSSTSSSDLGSSTDEEHEMKKARRQKWVTAGLATVATIHAASKIYKSIEKHDKRVLAVHAGEISPEEAHEQAKKARWQDAASMGIAALGIKGAISEWKETAEEHEKHREMMEKHQLQHKKRLEHERRKRAQATTGYYRGRDGQWYYDGRDYQDSQKRGSGARSTSTFDTFDSIDGPRQGERKMIEAPPQRSRSLYERDDNDSRSPVRSKSRKRHSLNPINNSLALAAWTAPFLGYGAYKYTQAEISDEPILKSSTQHEEDLNKLNAHDSYLKQRDSNRHEVYKDFGGDIFEEVLEHIGG